MYIQPIQYPACDIFGRGLLYNVVDVRMIKERYHPLFHYTGQLGEIHDHSFFVRGSFQDDRNSVCMTMQSLALSMISHQIMRGVKSEFFTK